MKTVDRIQFRGLAALLLAMLLAGCATTTTSTSEPKKDKSPIAMRAEARWNHLINAEFVEAWALYSPGWRSSNSAVDLQMNWRLRRVEALAAEYDSHECEELLCKVNINLTYRALQPVTGMDEYKNSRLFEEKWIKSEGKWYYLPE